MTLLQDIHVTFQVPWKINSEKLKYACFALQVDSAIHSNKDCLLISYVQYVNLKSLNEDVLFRKYVANRAVEVFNLTVTDEHMTEHGLKRKHCVGVQGLAGANQEDLAKCTVHVLQHTQRSASSKEDEP